MRLFLNMAGFLLLQLAITLPAPLFGISFEDNDIPSSPPGWFVISVWFVLFPLMGYARWVVTRPPADRALGAWILGLATLCALYIYYTVGLSSALGISLLWCTLVGNGVVIVLAIVLALRTARRSRWAGVALGLVALWVSFASIGVVRDLIAG
ncbi:hypothetical protein EMQ25_16445 [Arsenicitalea aurantiaca]|uniref:Tryptophan-rich sensory protein n=1 Tax=Arsenicitalea aurantiaca TaxID=1783274 RepID=A0A433X3C9_9HYPH|nr:tryptophan-rich sensory protein [Arsenicitalea aurantiaca]RUT28564.1 hypothetical protein EMQ25_16445 [Arsenicitalea aurantiaca]